MTASIVLSDKRSDTEELAWYAAISCVKEERKYTCSGLYVYQLPLERYIRN